VKSLSIIALIILVCVAGFFYKGYKPVWQYRHLEQNAKKVITGAELQMWATNLLNSYPPTNGWFVLSHSELGTNIPPQLLGLCPRLGPSLGLYLDNKPRSLRLFWSSGILGASGFEVGPPNFVGNGQKWQPGVYFFSND